MDQLIFTPLSHTHYWYEVGMLKVPAVVGGGGGDMLPDFFCSLFPVQQTTSGIGQRVIWGFSVLETGKRAYSSNSAIFYLELKQ